MSDKLSALKYQYNQALERNKKAEEYFKMHTVSECLKYLDLFNEVVKELSNLIIQIEVTINQHMTEYEKLNGFKL